MKRGILHWTDKTVGTLRSAKKAVDDMNTNVMLLNKAFPITTSRMLYNENRVVRQFFDGIKLYRGADFLLDILPRISPMEYKLLRVVEGGFAEYQVSGGRSVKIRQDFTVYSDVNYELYYWYALWRDYPETVDAITNLYGSFEAKRGRVTLHVKPVRENGNFERIEEQIVVESQDHSNKSKRYRLLPNNTLRDVNTNQS